MGDGLKSPPGVAGLAELRAAIDLTDKELVRLLAHRLRLVEQVARLKRHPADVPDAARNRSVLARVKRLAREHGLPAAMAERLWSVILPLSIAHQIGLLEDDAKER